MAKFATVDGNGVATGFYDPAFGPVPSAAIPISQAQWQQWIADTNGLAWDGGGLVSYTAPVVMPSPTQLATAALMAGLNVTSASTPAIDGRYALDPASQAKIAAVEIYILKNGGFPGTIASYPWPLLGGGLVTFPSTAVFQAWATAIADYVSALDIIIAGNSGALPPATIAIA